MTLQACGRRHIDVALGGFLPFAIRRRGSEQIPNSAMTDKGSDACRGAQTDPTAARYTVRTRPQQERQD